LHRFRDIALEIQNRYIWLPLFGLTPPTERFPCREDLRKIFTESSHKNGQGTKWRRNIADNFNPVSRAHKRYRRQRQTDRQTDGRTTTYSERERGIVDVSAIPNNLSITKSCLLFSLPVLACCHHFATSRTYFDQCS